MTNLNTKIGIFPKKVLYLLAEGSLLNLKVATIMDMERNEMNQVDGSKQFCPEDSKKSQNKVTNLGWQVLFLLCWVLFFVGFRC